MTNTGHTGALDDGVGPKRAPMLDETTITPRLDAGGAAIGFILYRYTDSVTGEVEVVWNSRPGPAPVQIVSRAGNVADLEWGDDCSVTRAADHVPAVGDRIIVDMTPQRARQLAEERVSDIEQRPDAWAEQHEHMYKTFASRAEAVADAVLHFEEIGCDLMTVTSGWLEGLQRTRAQQRVPAPDAAAASTGTPAIDLRKLIKSLPAKLQPLLRSAALRTVPDPQTIDMNALRAVVLRFRGLDGELIEMGRWAETHMAAASNIVRHDSVHSDDVIELCVMTAWTGVECGDGLIFEHVVGLSFHDSAGRVPSPDDHHIRNTGWSRTMREANAFHEHACKVVREHVASGELAELADQLSAEHPPGAPSAERLRLYAERMRAAAKTRGGKAS